MIDLPTKETLDKWQSIATIISLSLIPIATTWLGYNIQESTSNQNIKKDYVQMAIRILTDPKKPGDDDLRKWATDVLAQNSPVPFTQTLKQQLWAGATLSMFAWSKFPDPPENLLKPPFPAREPFKENIEENYKRANENAKTLIELQEWVKKEHERNKDPNSIPKWLRPQGAMSYGPVDPKDVEE